MVEDVDKTGSYHKARGVDRLIGLRFEFPDGGNNAVAHEHIRPPLRCAGTVNQTAVLDENLHSHLRVETRNPKPETLESYGLCGNRTSEETGSAEREIVGNV